ncbi:MAG: hypothetical protein V1667_02010 [bacterium]
MDRKTAKAEITISHEHNTEKEEKTVAKNKNGTAKTRIHKIAANVINKFMKNKITAISKLISQFFLKITQLCLIAGKTLLLLITTQAIAYFIIKDKIIAAITATAKKAICNKLKLKFILKKIGMLTAKSRADIMALIMIFKLNTGQKFKIPEFTPSLKTCFLFLMAEAELFTMAAWETVIIQTKNKKTAKIINKTAEIKTMFKVSLLKRWPIFSKDRLLNKPVAAILFQKGNKFWPGLALGLLNKISNSPPLPSKAAKIPNHQKYLLRHVSDNDCFKIFL